MLRGRNTNGMVGFSAFFPGECADGPLVTSVKSVDSDDASYSTYKAISRPCDRSAIRITERRMRMTFSFVSESHRLNVRLTEPRRRESGRKSSWFPWGRILSILISNAVESVNDGCVRGPPC